LIDTTYLTEFDLVDVQDDTVVGMGVSLQTHLFEDRVMKMSTLTIESGASVGPRSVVLYDSSVGEGCVVGPLSLVMKGEELGSGTRWAGIPAEYDVQPDAGHRVGSAPRWHALDRRERVSVQ
jgi:non-ribosomal peptide synthetase-like protein